MGLLTKLEDRLRKDKFNHAKFQSFVCWMLFICAVLALMVPTGVVVNEAEEFGCLGEEFTIVSHYGSVDWMQDMFSDFKNYTKKNLRPKGTITFDICYRLVISETAPLDRSYRPVIYQPQNMYWVDEANSDYQTNKANRYLVENTNESCLETTSIPFGLVARSKFAEALEYLNGPIDFQEIIQVASLGWKNYTRYKIANGSSIDQLWEDTFHFAMGHPNVTSSGYFTLYMALKALGSHGSTDVLTDIQPLTNSTYEISPNDLFHLNTLRDFDEAYLHATMGFENDVIQYNKNYPGLNLTFVYFTETFWVTYPICVLQDANYLTNRQLKLGNKFKEYTNTKEKLDELLNYGMRPTNVTDFDWGVNNSTDIYTTNRVNKNITKSESLEIQDLSETDVDNLRIAWRGVKRPAYVSILLDTSKDMAKTVSLSKTRWIYAKRAIDILPRVLENSAVVNVTCFAKYDSTTKCGGNNDFNQTGTLQNTRQDLVQFLDDEITTSTQRNTAFYSELSDKIQHLRNLKDINPSRNYFIVVISGDDKTDPKDAITQRHNLTNIAESNSTSDEIHVFPILFFGTEFDEDKPKANYTWIAMQQVAEITNGRSWSAKEDLEDVFDVLRYYF